MARVQQAAIGNSIAEMQSPLVKCFDTAELDTDFMNAILDAGNHGLSSAPTITLPSPTARIKRDGVALGDDAGAQMIVEGHTAIRHLVFEVDVLGAQGGVFGKGGEGQSRGS